VLLMNDEFLLLGESTRRPVACSASSLMLLILSNSSGAWGAVSAVKCLSETRLHRKPGTSITYQTVGVRRLGDSWFRTKPQQMELAGVPVTVCGEALITPKHPR
jgi:hypothetical protein